MVEATVPAEEALPAAVDGKEKAAEAAPAEAAPAEAPPAEAVAGGGEIEAAEAEKGNEAGEAPVPMQEGDEQPKAGAEGQALAAPPASPKSTIGGPGYEGVITLEKETADRIRQQFEFYFSDSNLPKDKFLRTLLTQAEDSKIEIAVLGSFNKIRTLFKNTYNMSIPIVLCAR